MRLTQAGYSLVPIRSLISLLISINFIIINYISQLANLISFLCLALLPDLCFSIIVLLLDRLYCSFWFREILGNKWLYRKKFYFCCS